MRDTMTDWQAQLLADIEALEAMQYWPSRVYDSLKRVLAAARTLVEVDGDE